MYDSSSTFSHIDYMVFKYQSLGFIKEEKKKKKRLLKTSVNAHNPDFFLP